jgi:hypothetical protein
MLADPRVAGTGAVTCERCAVPRRANHHERLPGSRRTRSRGSRDPFRMATSGIAGNTFASIAVDAFGGAVRVPHAFPSRPSEIACKAPIFKMRTATDRAGASHRVPKRAPELLDRRRGAARRVRALAGRRGRPPAARRSLASVGVSSGRRSRCGRSGQAGGCGVSASPCSLRARTSSGWRSPVPTAM